MKKILSLLIALALCCGAVPIALAEDDLQTKVEYISSLGIMTGYEDGSFRTDNPITRAEFTAVSVRLAGQEESAQGGMYDGRFSDVSSDFWGSGYIALASNMGIINGYTDGTFLPNNNVTYNEAIKMIVCLLGYGLQAEKQGGYPTGYTAVASKLKLLDFKYYEPTAPINRGEVARLVYKSLDTELMITESVGTDGNYILGKGGTVLEMLHSAETKEGVVTGTPLDSIHDDGEISEGFVEINDTLYLTDINCSSLLGERVEYVVTDTDKGEKVVYIKPDALMKSVVVDAKDVVDVKGIFTSNGQIRYWTANKSVRKVSFNAAIDVIYNNKVLSYENAGSIDFEKDPDVYECIDTDSDGTYDLLKLKAYDDNYVKKVYVDGLKQMAVTDSNIAITNDPEDEDLFITVILDGEIVPFEEIKEGDIISYAKSLDSKAYEIIISRESFEGTVSARAEDETEIILTLEGKDYDVSENLIEKQRVPALNDSGKFYLSYKGEIAYFEGTDLADGKYGFLTAVGSKGSINASCEIKILEANNTFSIYPLAKKVKLSDKGVLTTKTASEIVSMFYKGDTWDDMRTAYTQIIRYKLNSDGEVNYIATAKETPDEHSFSVAAPNRKRLYSNSLFDQKWKITNDTIVFYIPSTKEGEDYTRYRSGSASSFLSSGNTYQVVLYDADENGEVGAVFYSLTGQLREQTFSIDLGSSKVITTDTILKFFDGVILQADYIADFRAGETYGNWGAAAAAGLLVASVMLPEYKNASKWKEIAVKRIQEILDVQFYPDGAQIELTPTYQCGAVEHIVSAIKIAKANGVELNVDIKRFEKIFEYLLKIATPNCTSPAFNDSPWKPLAQIFKSAHSLFEKRDDFLWFAEEGKRGNPPSEKSLFIPYAGYAIMRTGYGENDVYTAFDVGPYGL